MNSSMSAINQITNYAKTSGIKLRRILVPRRDLNGIRIGVMSMGLDPIDYYDPKIPGRNLRFQGALLVEDLTIDEIHAEIKP